MGDNTAEAIIQIRSSVDRRKIKDRRFFSRYEDLGYNSENRGKMIERRMLGDRRRILPEIMNTFWEEAL